MSNWSLFQLRKVSLLWGLNQRSQQQGRFTGMGWCCCCCWRNVHKRSRQLRQCWKTPLTFPPSSFLDTLALQSASEPHLSPFGPFGLSGFPRTSQTLGGQTGGYPAVIFPLEHWPPAHPPMHPSLLAPSPAATMVSWRNLGPRQRCRDWPRLSREASCAAVWALPPCTNILDQPVLCFAAISASDLHLPDQLLAAATAALLQRTETQPFLLAQRSRCDHIGSAAFVLAATRRLQMILPL